MRKEGFLGLFVKLFLLSAVIIGGIGQITETYAADAKMQKVRIGYLVGDQLHQPVLPIGEAKGYFKEEGLQVEALQYKGSGILLQHFGANECDFGLVGISAAIAGKTTGADVVIVDSLNHGGSAMVVDPSINKFEDLRDQPVGTPSVGGNQHTLLTILEKKHSCPVKKVTVSPTDSAVFARNKEVKAIFSYEPWPTKVAESAGFKLLYKSDDVLEDQQCCLILTHRSYIKAHPDVVEKMVRINAKATKYMRDHPDEAIKILAQASGHDVNLLTKAFKNMSYPWPPVVSEKSSKIILQELIDTGKVKAEAIKPDLDTWWNELYDKTFEKKLVESGYIQKLEKEGVPK
ncbi:ABC transporter substrate-binding protein [Desulfomonile tiedjei]|uniref:ABC-type nitrate/sulfonate/bicarbonate transport system, periplasmic component n=1 Tax=Desulfomonile tiedjei (strain ATCC 49306 / DSM 6799 / DCB-1) TaxID=706587 RepID=I4CDZ9_DESTA|nr:ABC transporter substrate-binding protein [Desulfomonile tiedjei]AFM27790.1 ABC-type nitrate/sulfonate/bicarbonate transport system, periplasmic component [Desulfomonile tiedjei DSM 6799]